MNLAGRPAAPFENCYVPEPNTGCWLWLGSVDVHGYGQKRLNKKLSSAHRLSWTLANGEIPPDAEVCHRCDNPPCVNPAHLFLGSHAENMADMAMKGRTGISHSPRNVGSANGRARLAIDDVLTIRRLIASGANHGEIAEQFATSPANVSAIGLRRSWRHV